MKKNTKEQMEVDSTKREFIKKFGSYAATAPVGMYMLMTPSSSAAHTSGHGHKGHGHCGNGHKKHGPWGNNSPWGP